MNVQTNKQTNKRKQSKLRRTLPGPSTRISSFINYLTNLLPQTRLHTIFWGRLAEDQLLRLRPHLHTVLPGRPVEDYLLKLAIKCALRVTTSAPSCSNTTSHLKKISQVPPGDETKQGHASSKGPDKSSTKPNISNRPPKGSGDLVKLSNKYSSLDEIRVVSNTEQKYCNTNINTLPKKYCNSNPNTQF